MFETSQQTPIDPFKKTLIEILNNKHVCKSNQV